MDSRPSANTPQVASGTQPRAPNPERPVPGLFAGVYRPAPGERSDLVQVADAFSPRYEQPRADVIVIDISGLERLLGSPRTIADEIRRDGAARGLHVHVAVASSRVAALVLAQARPGVTVVPAGGEAAALASLPLACFAQVADAGVIEPGGPATRRGANAQAATAVTAMLAQWGLRTWGELAALPAAELAARLGVQGPRWQQLARGVDVRPLVPLRADERFEASIELEWPIEGLEPLSFVLTRLLEPLSTRLERADRGVATLHTMLRLVTRDVHLRALPLPSPLRDVRALRTLALLDLDAHPPAAAIDQVTITIDPTPARVLQHTLFTRPQPTPEELSTLIARLHALMGQDRVGAPLVVDSHRPGAFAMSDFALDHDRRKPHITSSPQPPVPGLEPPVPSLVSALRRCRHPVPARVAVGKTQRPERLTTDRRGYVGGAITSCAGPWQTSGAWWETGLVGQPGQSAQAGGAGRAGECAWEREEWDVVTADGTMYRIHRDCARDAWFIDGIVD